MENQMTQIKNIIKSCRTVAARVSELQKSGFETGYAPMGSGGVGQIKNMANGTKRMQIGYGVSRHNYAYFVILK